MDLVGGVDIKIVRINDASGIEYAGTVSTNKVKFYGFKGGDVNNLCNNCATGGCDENF